MEIKKGDYVTRNSYDNDTIFKVMNIKNNICYLKGVDVRLYADSGIDDLVKIEYNKDNQEDVVVEEIPKNDRDEFFYLPGKILHIDGDDDYLKRCLKYYKEAGVFAVGKKISEANIYECIIDLLKEYKPDIVIITGHDAYYKKRNDVNNIKNYKNSENFVKAIHQARRYESSHEKLVIIAGACQSDYEALIKAGANYASSPKRINIHALDPAIIATSLSLTERNKLIDLPALLDKTKYGKDGIGGIIGNGLMYVGYPRQ
ncbi:MAG: sporulation peptidase YabG [Bacilli bacterium]|nr:sporulation peptidase YabG [Bacilli bacterium]